MPKLLIILFLTTLAWCQSAFCDETKFIRISKDSEGREISLDTSVSTYQKDTFQIDLISAVHIADKSYYENLNNLFKEYDSVLYELIKPEEVSINEINPDQSNSIISKFQESLKDILDLEFQLNQIDYKAKNFVHADMSSEQFEHAMQKRGDTLFSFILKLLLKSSEFKQESQGELQEITLLKLLFSPDRERVIKLIVAKQFQDIEGISKFIDGEEGSAILSDRNKVVIETIKSEQKMGKRKIAVFFGAGHMPDLERRLLQEMSFKKTSEKYLIAWDLRATEH